MGSPHVPQWENDQTPRSIVSSDATSSPALSYASKTFSHHFSSSTSTVASSPGLNDSCDGFALGKPTLDQVQEESSAPVHVADTPLFGLGNLPADEAFYNFDDTSSSSQNIADVYPSAKKPRSEDSLVSPVISKRFNSLSKKWKTRTGAGPKLSIDTVKSNPVQSRQGSAGSTVLSPALNLVSQRDSRLPPSPARSVFDENSPEARSFHIDIDSAQYVPSEEPPQARTPLLPPIVAELASQKQSPVQSPLQSPTVAETFIFPDSLTPVETPRASCLPSPPLSSKPSKSSLRQRSRAGTLVPSADIPPMIIDSDSEDLWSVKLGHADFTIYPEPYLPETLSRETLKAFLEQYHIAKTNFAKHLARTGENAGTTSRVYKMTEEKWCEIDTEWKQYNATILAAVKVSDLQFVTAESVPVPVIPPTDIVTGKFPVLGDEDIVGPMSVAPALQRFISNDHQTRLVKKRNFFKFLSDLLAKSNVRTQA